MVFDNRKVRELVRPLGQGGCEGTPFEQGAREIVAWHDEDSSRRRVDPRLDEVMDLLVERYAP